MQFKRDNHYIPQFYLKQWGNSEKKVWEYRLLVSHDEVPLWQLSSIKGSLGWHKDLYTGIENDAETDEIENWYEKVIENPAKHAIECVACNNKLEKDDLTKLIRFVAAQYVRTPAGYFRVKELFEKDIHPRIVGSLTAKNRLVSANDTHATNNIKDFKWLPLKIELNQPTDENENLKLKFETGFTRNMWHFINLSLLDRAFMYLLEREWHIVKTPPGVSLYTNDDPVAFVNIHNTNNYNFGGGWRRNAGEVFFPITPNHFLYSGNNTRLDEKDIQGMLFKLVYWMQRITIENAFRSVYSKSENSRITLCRKRVVSEDYFRNEKILWQQWNNKQISFEQEFKRKKID